MSQQITIIAIMDVKAALKVNSLEENIYFLDNLRTEGSRKEGTSELVTAIKGSHWCDGSQACDIVLNWFAIDIGSLPPTLPKNYMLYRSKSIDQQWIQALKGFHSKEKNDNAQVSEPIKNIIDKLGNSDQIKDLQGRKMDLDIKALNVFGEPFHEGDHMSGLSYVPPHISAISGEAIEKEVLFPAQYGTPVTTNEGWYWSSTVDTHKTGIYTYTLHFTLYKREGNFWTPVEMTYDSKIDVTSEPQRNGFTQAGIGVLPII